MRSYIIRHADVLTDWPLEDLCAIFSVILVIDDLGISCEIFFLQCP